MEGNPCRRRPGPPGDPGDSAGAEKGRRGRRRRQGLPRDSPGHAGRGPGPAHARGRGGRSCPQRQG